MFDYGPWARIVLRYLVGAAFVGSPEIGKELAMDPDIVMAVSAGIGVAVELIYTWAKKRGGKT
jgi:hypothetical protein